MLLVGLTTAAAVIFGVACWHLVRRRNQELFRHAAKLALIVGVPISAVNLGVGSHLGVVVTDYQPMKIASTEAQWDTCQPCAFSLFQIGGFTVEDQTPTFSIQIPKLLSLLATGSLDGEVVGMNSLQQSDEAEYGNGDYIPPVRTTYWSMRIMAYAGTLSSSSCSRSGRSSTGAGGSRRRAGSCGPAFSRFRSRTWRRSQAGCSPR